MAPFFVPTTFNHVIDTSTKLSTDEVYEHTVSYELNFIQRVFVTMEYPYSCQLGSIVLYTMSANIIINILVYVLASVPSFKYIPSSCENPVCDFETLCPNRTICEPVPFQSLILINAAGIVIFSADYLIRVIASVTVPPRVAGITEDQNLSMKKIEIFFNFICKFDNIIDLCSILPFYLILIRTKQFGGLSSGFVRILRMPRLLQSITNIEGESSTIAALITILFRCLKRSGKVLLFTLYFYAIGILLFATIIFALEEGNFRVNNDNPHGAYLRDNLLRTGLETSPFRSIPLSIYYTVVTTSTLGYGDFACQTVGGRAVACLLCFAGIIVLALPIAIIGSNFFDFYCIYLEKLTNIQRAKDEEKAKLKLLYNSESIDQIQIALKHEVNVNKLPSTIGRLSSMSFSQHLAVQRALGLLNVVHEKHLKMFENMENFKNSKSHSSCSSDEMDYENDEIAYSEWRESLDDYDRNNEYNNDNSVTNDHENDNSDKNSDKNSVINNNKNGHKNNLKNSHDDDKNVNNRGKNIHGGTHDENEIDNDSGNIKIRRNINIFENSRFDDDVDGTMIINQNKINENKDVIIDKSNVDLIFRKINNDKFKKRDSASLNIGIGVISKNSNKNSERKDNENNENNEKKSNVYDYTDSDDENFKTKSRTTNSTSTSLNNKSSINNNRDNGLIHGSNKLHKNNGSVKMVGTNSHNNSLFFTRSNNS